MKTEGNRSKQTKTGEKQIKKDEKRKKTCITVPEKYKTAPHNIPRGSFLYKYELNYEL